MRVKFLNPFYQTVFFKQYELHFMTCVFADGREQHDPMGFYGIGNVQHEKDTHKNLSMWGQIRRMFLQINDLAASNYFTMRFGKTQRECPQPSEGRRGLLQI
jgi:hypothetical protein